MHQVKDAYTEHQLKRWMAPNAHHFVRPDWRHHVRPGFENESPFERYERKYSPDQPRDDHGRWTSEGAASSGQGTGGDGSLTTGQGAQIAARISPQREAECELQLKLDRNICRIIGTESCWAQAMFRYSQCLTGGYVPPLYH